MVSFETNPYPHNAIKTICREKKNRWVLWGSHQIQSVILVSFFSLCLKRDYRKKGKIGLVYRTSSWRELLSTLNDSFTITKVLCISTENVKGACYISEIEDYLLPTYCICSPNAASEVQSYRFCHSWRVDALHIIVYKGMLTTKRIFCYKDSLISDKVLNIEVVKTVFLWKIRDFGIKCLPLHLQPPLASRWYSVHSGTFYKL